MPGCHFIFSAPPISISSDIFNFYSFGISPGKLKCIKGRIKRRPTLVDGLKMFWEENVNNYGCVINILLSSGPSVDASV